MREILYDLTRAERVGGLTLIRCLIALGLYVLSEKTQQLIADGWFELDDLERSILEGAVQKTEADELNDCVGNKKYIIVGPDVSGYEFYSVGKILRTEEGKTYFVITAHGFEVNYV